MNVPPPGHRMLYGGYIEPIDTCECAAGPCRDGAARERNALAAENARLVAQVGTLEAELAAVQAKRGIEHTAYSEAMDRRDELERELDRIVALGNEPVRGQDPWVVVAQMAGIAGDATRHRDEAAADRLFHDATKHRRTHPLAASMWTTPVDPNRPPLEGAKLDPTVTPEEMRKAMGDARMRDAAKALVAKWPQCWKCTRPATHLMTARPTRLCDGCVSSASVPHHRPDECGRQLVELEGAPELRVLMALLEDA